MSEAEKQEGQKTVVSFITGMLIGGLLVWVFSSSPEGVQAPVVESTDTETVVSKESNDTQKQETVQTNSGEAQTVSKETKPSTVVVGEGKIVAADQKEGATVTLGEVKFPTDAGWIVVRDYRDGAPGNVLGAARYGVAEGLIPSLVYLQRNTKAGNTYQVSFYTENGDKVFDLDDDTQIPSITTLFKAQ